MHPPTWDVIEDTIPKKTTNSSSNNTKTNLHEVLEGSEVELPGAGSQDRLRGQPRVPLREQVLLAATGDERRPDGAETQLKHSRVNLIAVRFAANSVSKFSTVVSGGKGDYLMQSCDGQKL